MVVEHTCQSFGRQDNMCYIEPYTSNRFACQFDYTQLYVGNPNKDLAYQGNLFEGSRGWFHFVVGGTGAEFALSQKSLVLNTVLSLCMWYYG